MDDRAVVDELLDRADAARASGRGADAARLYGDALDRARSAADVPRWTRAALGAAAVHVFGTEPGRLPAVLYDLLAHTDDDANGSRVAAALARCWAYSGRADRAARFAQDAVERAERTGSAALLADALDAALAAHWGPDELAERERLAARLDDVAAHVLDPAARLAAHLWGLQVALETLRLPDADRHLRALELLGDELPRARFFAVTRRLVLDLVAGRTDTADALLAQATVVGEQAELADAWLVVAALRGYAAAQAGDDAVCADVAARGERFALAEGATPVLAEVAYLWSACGRVDRVVPLLGRLGPATLDALPRDVNWLLTLQCTLEAALAAGDREVVAHAAGLLGPYEGRAVVNTGAVAFHGVTDDTLARAAALLGDDARAARLAARARATYAGIGARWWLARLEAAVPAGRAGARGDAVAEDQPAGSGPAAPGASRAVVLRPAADGLWLVGPRDAPVPVRARQGYAYLRELVRHPGREVDALTLVTQGHATAVQSGVEAGADARALRAYRERLREIDAELDEARAWSDLARTESLDAEREALLDEVARAAGLGGRRRLDGATHERARVAATKAIRSAIAALEAVDADLADHLAAAVRTGTVCVYAPRADDAHEWVVD